MKIIIGGDHTSIEMRQFLVKALTEDKHEIIDVGTKKNPSNYANCGFKVGENILMQKADFGIAICGSGIGISIATNKVHDVYCALVYNIEQAKLAKEHNNANAIALGSRFVTNEEALLMVRAFIEAKFEGGRHIDRIHTIYDYEHSCQCGCDEED